MERALLVIGGEQKGSTVHDFRFLSSSYFHDLGHVGRQKPGCPQILSWTNFVSSSIKVDRSKLNDVIILQSQYGVHVRKSVINSEMLDQLLSVRYR